ncbi:MAG TPA: ATP-binding protein [Bryobacteraceae bacterium]|nr:ATP-binding protein [Bryobacteraceae bacterium]
MKPLEWLRPPLALLTLFIGLMTVCALALGSLGWQVLVQDRAVERQRLQEQSEMAADRAVSAIEREFAFSNTEVTINTNGEVRITPAGALAYAPAQTEPPAVPVEIFAEAESLEFGKQDPTRAADAYARLAQSDNLRVRAEALVRLGRVLRRERKGPQALKTYASLEKLGSTLVAGMPAGLVARAARCSALDENGHGDAAQREAAALWAELTAGKWNVTKATLETYLKEVKSILPELELPAGWDEHMALAQAAQWGFAQEAAKGRAGLTIDGQMVSVSWERQSSGWSARLVRPSSWQALWTRLERDGGIVLRVLDAEGRVIHASGQPGRQAAFRAAAITGLPWSLAASSADDAATSGSWTARRRFLTGGLAVFALVLGLGSFVIARAISREIAVARLQSDFVSAVSHEFRTPLTSIRQLSEMLARGRMESDQHRQRAYELMLGQSDRLRRLVESLLDFGRMQAGEYKFRTDRLEAVHWTRSVSEEFEETVRSRGYAIEFTGLAEDAWIRGDREALGGALWNLLDNAVKYSPDEKQVRVAVSSVSGNVEVAVRDGGSGIAREDLKRVFGKFYRGANAKRQGTKGTGIGLAMVKEIVEAHGGMVRVRSEPGQGSEFTMVLPCHES